MHGGFKGELTVKILSMGEVLWDVFGEILNARKHGGKRGSA